MKLFLFWVLLGYGPLSSVQKYVPIGAGSQNVRRPASDETPLTDALSVIINNKMYLVIVIATAILFIFCVVWVTLCVTRRLVPFSFKLSSFLSSSKNKRAANTSARKRSVGGDLWINQSSGSHMRGARESSIPSGHHPLYSSFRLHGRRNGYSPHRSSNWSRSR